MSTLKIDPLDFIPKQALSLKEIKEMIGESCDTHPFAREIIKEWLVEYNLAIGNTNTNTNTNTNAHRVVESILNLRVVESILNLLKLTSDKKENHTGEKDCKCSPCAYKWWQVEEWERDERISEKTICFFKRII